VVVGMRGAGKSALSRKAAEHLGRQFLDLDEVLEKEVLGCSINDFVAKSGWPAFREAEAKLLEGVVLRREHAAQAAGGCIVACGGGVVETPSSQHLLSQISPVVFIDRHIDDIMRTLEGSGSYRPGLGVPPREVYARRLPIYRRCCSHIFTLRLGDEDWDALDSEFVRFLRHAEGTPVREVCLAADTFLVPLACPSLEDLVGEPMPLRRAAAGADVLEVRADLLARLADERWLLEQLAVLRRYSFAPICFTVRSLEQGGYFDGSTKAAVDLAKLAIKAGCQLVDVEAARFTAEDIADLSAMKGATKLIASHHDSRCRLQRAALDRLLRRFAATGAFDLARLALSARSEEDLLETRCVARRFLQQHPELPASLILLGEHGRLSCVLNHVMTPAVHPALPCPGAHGQMPVREVVECRSRLALLDAQRHFFIFGHPVALSASPTLQNTGFRVNNLPYVFGRYDAPDVEDVLWKLSLTSTGGGAVTIPHKEVLLEHMDELSESARAIGAVNTVTKETGTNRMKGDNTDWIGIKRQVEPKLKEQPGGRVGLILGAGGTARAAAYAFKQMGFAEVYLLNRTVEKAVEVAKSFGQGFKVAANVEELQSLKRLDAVMGTLPGTAGVTLPDGLVEAYRPVVVDAAYQSSASGKRFTALLQQALDKGCPVVEGLEILFEQGCAQCELWTGRSAPRREIACALLADRFAGDSNPPQGLVHESRLRTT